MAKTKIICTLGPASSNITIIRKMMLAGMDVARFNFSHGTIEEHQARLDTVRALNKKYRRSVKILQDLEGYRIRIGKFQDTKAIELKKHQPICLVKEDIPGNSRVIHLDYLGDFSDIKKGQDIFIDDGNLRLKVNRSESKRIFAQILVGGFLKERKGVNIPEANLRFPSLTTKDKVDIQFGISNKVDYIAQSFVRNKNGVLIIKNLVKKRYPHCSIIAKIESREAIKNIDEIIEASDAIMIARGDMGIAIPIYQIPIIQKMIIKKCNLKKKPVITATQMLEHMVEFSQPTRAETTDIANAILDGTDFLMLSAETASGNYPVESVSMMNKIVEFTEKSSIYKMSRLRNFFKKSTGLNK